MAAWSWDSISKTFHYTYPLVLNPRNNFNIVLVLVDLHQELRNVYILEKIEIQCFWKSHTKNIFLNSLYLGLFFLLFNRHTGEFMKRVREMSSQLFVTIYALFIYPSAHKQLRQHHPNPFREFSCMPFNNQGQITKNYKRSCSVSFIRQLVVFNVQPVRGILQIT